MNRVFVDTSGFYASFNRRDRHHHHAASLFHQAQIEHWFLFTTNFVISELHALILARMGRSSAWNFLQAITIGRTNIIRATENDEQRTREIIEHYNDKDFSYCDALSFAVMERLDIEKAIAFDEHFHQYGKFTVL